MEWINGLIIKSIAAIDGASAPVRVSEDEMRNLANRLINDLASNEYKVNRLIYYEKFEVSDEMKLLQTLIK